MKRDSVLERLVAAAPMLCGRYGVKTLQVFGSVARGDDNEHSDVDILTDFDGRATFDNFMGLKCDLEEILGKRVDLLTPRCLNPALRNAIEREAIRVS